MAALRPTELPTVPEPPKPVPATAPRFSLISVAGIARTSAFVGLYVGSNFFGTAPAPPAQTAGLPAGHPSIDPNAPRVAAPPLSPDQITPGASTGPAPAAPAAVPGAEDHTAPKEGYDLAFDDPQVQAAIAAAGDYGTLIHLGNEQFDQKHPKLAIAAYEKALKIHPFDPDVQTDLGIMYRAMHRHDDALNAFRKAAAMDPKHVQSRYNIGVVLAADENDAAGAVAAWKDFLKVAPPGPQKEEVKRRIAELEQAAGKPKGS
jgi:tetratricopeptide (TPR) repeat protein